MQWLYSYLSNGYIHLYWFGPPSLASCARWIAMCFIELKNVGGNILSNLQKVIVIFSSVSILTILKDLMKPCKTCPASQSKQVEVCSRSCLSVSEYDWPWKRTYAHLSRNSLAHGLNDLNQTIKMFNFS